MAKRKAKRVTRSLTEKETSKLKAARKAAEQDKAAILAKGQKHKRASDAARQLIARLRDERERAGISLADVKDKTGISREAICALENKEHPNPTVRTLWQYADALGLTVEIVKKDG